MNGLERLPSAPALPAKAGARIAPLLTAPEPAGRPRQAAGRDRRQAGFSGRRTSRPGCRRRTPGARGATRGPGRGFATPYRHPAGGRWGQRPRRGLAAGPARLASRRGEAGRAARSAPRSVTAGRGRCAWRPPAAGAPCTSLPPPSGTAMGARACCRRHRARGPCPAAARAGWRRALMAKAPGGMGSSRPGAGRPTS